MIVAESIGFAATHTITSILSDVPGCRVTHGSQNFETAGPIGSGSQTPEAFAASMAAAAEAGERPIAVHTNFDPRRLRPACRDNGIRYALLIREPRAQVNSCYAWAVNKVLDGDDSTMLVALKLALPVLPRIGVRASLPNLLYAYAINHVCSFNLVAVETGAQVLRMEDLLSDVDKFRAAFGLPDTVPLAHFEGEERRLASHRAKAGVDAVAAPERDLLLERFPVSAGGAELTVPQITEVLGYAA
ncbi:hypothetical protein [Pseudooceanicola sp. LIPI14-2-Ac024]|uniref:hypothetical protein n=1 Tax=Pseudooceanicola sp. LIPI14-2-Ac024 TaxID=3344875 RepID=UPI0035CE9730